MAINSLNDPGFLAQLSQQAASRTPLSNQRAANAAIGAGRSGASSQIPVAMQTQNPYFLNPGGMSAPQPMGALGPAGSTGPGMQTVTPGAPARPMMNMGSSPLGSNTSPFPGQGTLPPSSSLPPGGSPIPQGPVGSTGGGGLGLIDDAAGAAGKIAASPADDLLAQATASGMIPTASAGSAGTAAAGAARTATGAAQIFSNVTRMGLMRGAGVAGLGYMAAGIMDGMNIGGENSNADQGISGAVLGAGLGAGGAMALGLAAGPIGWAALGGAALFAGGKMLFGDNKTTPAKMQEAADKTRSSIQELSGLYGLPADATSELMMQYDVTTRLYTDNKDKEGLKAYLTGLSQTLPALMLQQKDQYDAEEKEQQRYEGMLATQAQFAPIFEQAIGQAQQASAGAMATANEVSHRLAVSAPNLSNLVRSGAATSNANANRLYAGYAAQMAMGPQANYQNRELADMQMQVEQQQLLDQYMQSAGG